MADAAPCAPDGRRELGVQTRRRLLDATRVLLCDRGEEGVTLRAITDAAGANVAAVSYHFGSKDELVRLAMEDALEAFVGRQVADLGQLEHPPALLGVARAVAGPVIAALTSEDPAEQARLRLAARVIGDRRADDWVSVRITAVHAAMAAALGQALPGVPEDELLFRVESACAILQLVAGLPAARAEALGGAGIEARVLPVMAGALSGGAAAGAPVAIA
jgi:AcrR family transcriptional regulator